MLKNFKRLISVSEFSKNVITLVSGTTLAQIIPLIIAPILSRIYTPEDFGRLAIYIAIVQIISVVSAGRYELAILLPDSNKDAVQVTVLSIIIVLMVSIATLIVVLLFSTEISILVGDPKLKIWLFFVPLSIFLMGVFNVLNYYSTRNKNFQNIAQAHIYRSTGGGMIQLILGIAKSAGNGLIIGQIASNIFGNLKLAKSFWQNKEICKTTTKSDLIKLSKRYINFPKFSVLGILLNAISVGIVNFIISVLYNITSVGFYSHAFKYLGAPVNLIANAIGQVYFQRIAKFEGGKIMGLEDLKRSTIYLALTSLLIFTPLFFVLEDLFVFIFGSQWRTAGEFAKVLVPLMAMRFVTSPLSLTLAAIEKQSIELLLQVLILLGSVCSWGYIYLAGMNIETSIQVYSITLTVVYFVALLLIFFAVNEYEKKHNKEKTHEIQ